MVDSMERHLTSLFLMFECFKRTVEGFFSPLGLVLQPPSLDLDEIQERATPTKGLKFSKQSCS
jgi:hypothetical protein